jgi:hypothetical protein
MQRRGNLGGRNPSGPWGRLRPVNEDVLEELGLPSKGDKRFAQLASLPRDTCTNTRERAHRLLNHSTQEKFYSKIVEKYMAFCTDAGDSASLVKRFASLDLSEQGSAETLPSSAQSAAYPTQALKSGSTELSQILGALRKLREGIVASKRADTFASQVYLFAIRLGVLCSSPETYHPAILHLLRVIHPIYSLTSVEIHEVVAYLVLDAACRRGDLAEAFAIRNKYGLRDAKLDAALRALAQDNWTAFFRVRNAVDGHRAKIMGFAETGIRKHLLKAFGRSYLAVPLQFLESSTGMTWDQLRNEYSVGWELSEEKVVIRKIQQRKG